VTQLHHDRSEDDSSYSRPAFFMNTQLLQIKLADRSPVLYLEPEEIGDNSISTLVNVIITLTLMTATWCFRGKWLQSIVFLIFIVPLVDIMVSCHGWNEYHFWKNCFLVRSCIESYCSGLLFLAFAMGVLNSSHQGGCAIHWIALPLLLCLLRLRVST